MFLLNSVLFTRRFILCLLTISCWICSSISAQVYVAAVPIDTNKIFLDVLIQNEKLDCENITATFKVGDQIEVKDVLLAQKEIPIKFRQTLSDSYNHLYDSDIFLKLECGEWKSEDTLKLNDVGIFLLEEDMSANFSNVYLYKPSGAISMRLISLEPQTPSTVVISGPAGEILVDTFEIQTELKLLMDSLYGGDYTISLYTSEDSFHRNFNFINPDKVVVDKILSMPEIDYQNNYFRQLSDERLDKAAVLTGILMDSRSHKTLQLYRNSASNQLLADFIYQFWFIKEGDKWKTAWDGYTQRANDLYQEYNSSSRSAILAPEFNLLLKYGEPDQKVEETSAYKQNPYKLWIYNSTANVNKMRYYLMVKSPLNDYYSMVLNSELPDQSNEGWENILFQDPDDAMNPFTPIALKIRELRNQ